MMKQLLVYILGVTLICCSKPKSTTHVSSVQIHDVLDYNGSPTSKSDKSMLMFSDKGSWFAFSFPDSISNFGGFSGPFLMTQDNGVWLSPTSLQYAISKVDGKQLFFNTPKTTSYNSHLAQVFNSNEISVSQVLTFSSGHTALTNTEIKNTSDATIKLTISISSQPTFIDGLTFESEGNQITINSDRSTAIGRYILPFTLTQLNKKTGVYKTEQVQIELQPNESENFEVVQSFIFPEYSWKKELSNIESKTFDHVLISNIQLKEKELKDLTSNLTTNYQDSIYQQVLTKAHLTLQNNWRVPSGEISYQGLFPSYHYKWFQGFWSWDSWKHAVGLSYYNTSLAKDQMKLMFEFQNDDGFVADCVYRDNLIEEHNYRDTKPPLAAWAVTKIYEKDMDIEFVKYMYPKLKKYHNWWYSKRDHDQDGLCEYGSTDGTLIAAKWESGMDNAIRFDDSKILENEEGAYSLDQESVDLNAYLYAEKLYLAQLSKALQLDEEEQYLKDAKVLKEKLQIQFYDPIDGWFYDTTLDGKTFIKGEGSEGWTALWAKAVTQEQAIAVKNSMMDPSKFFTKVPFQTMSADHEKFDPLRGYWRGPNWLDQAYFGVRGLKNYGFNEEAHIATVQICKGAEGLLDKGSPIRENYHPLTGKGLHAKNFSWSAAHIIMLLLEE